jgi:hypothetical protein
MVDEGLGELDKSGIAELTFKGRHESKKADAGAGAPAAASAPASA